MSILWGVKNDGSQGFPLTKLMAVNRGLARLRRLRWLIIKHDQDNHAQLAKSSVI